MAGRVNDPESKDIFQTKASLQCRMSKFESRIVTTNDLLEKFEREEELSQEEKRVLTSFINHARELLEHFVISCEDDMLGETARSKIETSFLPGWEDIKRTINIKISEVFEETENGKILKTFEINMRNFKAVEREFETLWITSYDDELDGTQFTDSRMSILSNRERNDDFERKSIHSFKERESYNSANSIRRHSSKASSDKGSSEVEEKKLLEKLIQKYLKIEEIKSKVNKTKKSKKARLSSSSDESTEDEYSGIRHQMKKKKSQKLKACLSESEEETIENGKNMYRSRSLQLDLPKFNGDYNKFQDFFSMFNLMVHNSNKTEIEKLYHLKSCMIGRPSDLLSFLPIERGNYKKAYKLLQETFDKPEERRRALKHELQTLEKCTFENMRTTFDRIKTIVSSLSSYSNVDSEEMITMIKQKFPKTVIRTLLLQKQMRKEPLTLTETLDHIEYGINAEIELQEECGKNDYEGLSRRRPTLNFFTQKTSYNQQERRSYNKPTYNKINNNESYHPKRFDQPQRFRNSSSPFKLNESKICAFCKYTNHESNDCRKIKDPSERLEVIRTEKRCWICYSLEHNSFKCSREKCSFCGQSHNSALCIKQKFNDNNNAHENTQRTENNFSSGRFSGPLTGGNMEPVGQNKNFRFTPITTNRQ